MLGDCTRAQQILPPNEGTYLPGIGPGRFQGIMARKTPELLKRVNSQGTADLDDRCFLDPVLSQLLPDEHP